MFQIPKLPELLLSMNDYGLMKGMFTGGQGVSISYVMIDCHFNAFIDMIHLPYL